MNPLLKTEYLRRTVPETTLEDYVNTLLSAGWEVDRAFEEAPPRLEFLYDSEVEEEEIARYLTARSAEGFLDLEYEKTGEEQYNKFVVTGYRPARFFLVTAARTVGRA